MERGEAVTSPDGSYLVVGGSDNDCAEIVEAVSGAVLREIERGEAVTSVAWSPDGSCLVVGGSEYNNAEIVEAVSGAVLVEIERDDEVTAFAWSPDGSRLVLGGCNNWRRRPD